MMNQFEKAAKANAEQHIKKFSDGYAKHLQEQRKMTFADKVYELNHRLQLVSPKKDVVKEYRKLMSEYHYSNCIMREKMGLTFQESALLIRLLVEE